MPDLQQLFTRAWQRRQRWLWLLLPFEWLYRAVVLLRKRAYTSGLLHRHRATVPVVIVGNITVGGSGKTPVVIALANALARSGAIVGVISRGYGRSSSGLQIVSDHSDAAQVGDEPLLIARRTACVCAVAESRAVAAAALVEQFGVQIIISDDGLQHYALERDLEILLYDAEHGFGSGHCLPVGPLREPLSRLREADILLAKNSDLEADCVYFLPGVLVNLLSGQCVKPSVASIGERVYAYAGVAHPQSFLNTLHEQGFSTSDRLFNDHHVFCCADFDDVGDMPIIMTEKDAVKCASFATVNMWFLRVDAHVPEYVHTAVSELLQ